MNRIKHIILASVCALASTGCYEDYIKDYEYSAVYAAYQYDLRSFVVGEGMEFEIGAVLAGVMENKGSRKVWYEFEDDLVTGNLRIFNPSVGRNFTAFDVFTGKVSGDVSQGYVKTDVLASGISGLTPLPLTALQLNDERCLKIAKGRHTGTVKIKADSAAFLALPGASPKPYYAIGFHITSAEADTVLLSKSYEVIALRYENMLFGNWTRSRGNEVYELKTVAPNAVKTNYIDGMKAEMTLTLGSDGTISLSSDGLIAIEDLGCRYNQAKLLQNREIYLHYKYTTDKGENFEVEDTLKFRNRLRDGVNEWQDENPEHYK